MRAYISLQAPQRFMLTIMCRILCLLSYAYI